MVRDQHGNVLGRVARRVQHLDGDIAKFKLLAVANAAEWKRHLRSLEQHIVGARRLGERAARRHVIGMQMRVDHVADAHAGLVRPAPIGGDVADGIDYRGGRAAGAAKQVRRAHRIEMQVLTQDHGSGLPGEGRLTTSRLIQ